MDKKYISDNKRVILITGDQSNWFEQAIFIVKKSRAALVTQADFIREAEQIISNYMNGVSPRTPKLDERDIRTREQSLPALPPHTRGQGGQAARGKKTKLDIAVNIVIAAACVALIVMAYRGLIR